MVVSPIYSYAMNQKNYVLIVNRNDVSVALKCWLTTTRSNFAIIRSVVGTLQKSRKVKFTDNNMSYYPNIYDLPYCRIILWRFALFIVKSHLRDVHIHCCVSTSQIKNTALRSFIPINQLICANHQIKNR
jgi:hypothetical protein